MRERSVRAISAISLRGVEGNGLHQERVGFFDASELEEALG